MPVRRHIHTHTCRHALASPDHIRQHTYASCPHMPTHTPIIRSHACTRSHTTCISPHTHWHIRLHMPTHTPAYAYMLTYTPTHDDHVHTYIYPHIPAYTSPYTHAHTHTPAPMPARYVRASPFRHMITHKHA